MLKGVTSPGPFRFGGQKICQESTRLVKGNFSNENNRVVEFFPSQDALFSVDAHEFIDI